MIAKSPVHSKHASIFTAFLAKVAAIAFFVGCGVLHSNAANSITIQSPTGGSNVTASNDNLTVSITYASGGGGYQTPVWAYRIGSHFPGYGSPHGGTQVLGTTTVNDVLNAQSFGMRMISVALLDQNGALHNPPVTSNVHVNYQSPGGNYQSPGGNYQSPAATISLRAATISLRAATTSPRAAVVITFKFWFRLPLQGFIRLMTTSSFP